MLDLRKMLAHIRTPGAEAQRRNLVAPDQEHRGLDGAGLVENPPSNVQAPGRDALSRAGRIDGGANVHERLSFMDGVSALHDLETAPRDRTGRHADLHRRNARVWTHGKLGGAWSAWSPVARGSSDPTSSTRCSPVATV